jgi:hypothetical protein
MKMKNMLRRTINEAPINHIEEEVEDMMSLVQVLSVVELRPVPGVVWGLCVWVSVLDTPANASF